MSNSFALLCAVIVVSASVAAGQTNSGVPIPAISDLGKQYVGLNRTLYDGSPDPKLVQIGDEKAVDVAKGSYEILQKGILLLLDSYGNDAAAIKKGINNIQGEFAVGPDSADCTNVPFIDPFVINSDEGAAVAYLSGDSPHDQPVLKFYARSNGRWGPGLR